jgi:hypothetical protein
MTVMTFSPNLLIHSLLYSIGIGRRKYGYYMGLCIGLVLGIRVKVSVLKSHEVER